MLNPDNGVPEYDWIMLTHTQISESIGVNPLNDNTRRAIHGIKEGGKSGTPYSGLLTMGLIVAEELSIELSGGTTHFRITQAGRIILTSWLTAHDNTFPTLRAKKIEQKIAN